MMSIQYSENDKLTLRYKSAQFEDMARFFAEPFRYELNQGELIRMAPSSMLPSMIAGQIYALIWMHLRENPIGYLTTTDGAYHLSEDTTYAPDVGFISKSRLASPIAQGYVPISPDLAVKVVSPTDEIKRVVEKAKTYLQHGTKLVWIVYPSTQTIDVYHSDSIKSLTKHDILTGDDVLPNLTISIHDIFAVIDS